MRKFLKSSSIIGVLILVLTGVISCEEDFTDIGTSIVSNTKFDTNDTILDVLLTQRDIVAIRADNILTGSTGEYWLGVYEDPKGDYEKIEASIVTQLAAISNVNLEEGVTDTTRVTVTMDNAFLKFPYLATRDGNKDLTLTDINGNDSIIKVPDYSLDNVLGSTTNGVSLKVYRNNTYLSLLNPDNPAKVNTYQSDAVYEKTDLLNEDANFSFIPNANDTIHLYDRFLSDGSVYKDTLKLTNANPFLVIPLDKSKIESFFFDKLNSSELTAQSELNNYFRGLVIEASGSENSLVPFRFFNPQQTYLNPTLEINYTTTVEHTTTNAIVDTLKRSVTVNLSGIQNRIYKMTPEQNAASNSQVIIQGAAGKKAEVEIFSGNQLSDLRAKNWLINDATITFYIDQSKDTTAIPERLFLYREAQGFPLQIKDTYEEGLATFSGLLVKDGIKNDSYSFKITDYISDVLGPNSLENAPLVLKTYNQTDTPLTNGVLDTIVKNYNWNPRAVTISNQLGTRKAQIKISYTKKK